MYGNTVQLTLVGVVEFQYFLDFFKYKDTIIGTAVALLKCLPKRTKPRPKNIPHKYS